MRALLKALLMTLATQVGALAPSFTAGNGSTEILDFIH